MPATKAVSSKRNGKICTHNATLQWDDDCGRWSFA